MSQIPTVNTPRLLLGHVSAPSGALVILDGGLMHLWHHDRDPIVPPGTVDEELRAKMNAEVDLAIEGPEAVVAGKNFDRQWNPNYLFDIPREAVDKITSDFQTMVREKDLIARVVQLPRRIHHRQRIDLALEHGQGAGEIQFHGVMGAAVAHVPRGQELPVTGQRCEGEERDKSRWRHVLIDCRPELKPTRTEFAGYLGVDEGRLLIADIDALGSWKHDESLDGLADFAFFGKDAEKLAEKVGAQSTGHENEYGWRDLPVDEARQIREAVIRTRDKHKLEATGGVRLHSHHYLAMDQVRSTDTESASLSVGGAWMCLFMTTWGDGAFEVWRDLDDAGQLVRIRIDLGNERIVQRQRRFEELWFGAFAKLAFVSKRITDDREPVRWLYREPPDNADDSGWRIYAGDEDQEYCDNANNVALVPLRDLIRLEKTLEEVFKAPVGAAFERSDADETFTRVEDWKPPDEE